MADSPLHREEYPELLNRQAWLAALRERRTAIVVRKARTQRSADETKLSTLTRDKVNKRLARIDKTLQEIDDKLNKLELALTGVFD